MTKPEEKKTAAALKGMWRDQVCGDHDLKSYQARIVGYWMADCFTLDDSKEHYRETGEMVVFCGQKYLATLVGCNEAQVSRAVKLLQKRKHLEIGDVEFESRRGGRPPNGYRILLQQRKAA